MVRRHNVSGLPSMRLLGYHDLKTHWARQRPIRLGVPIVIARLPAVADGSWTHEAKSVYGVARRRLLKPGRTAAAAKWHNSCRVGYGDMADA